jgi:2-keto-4-pentenoate hydratase/2-oxohepta-3-ene-1,7-dioic acid hydratase in catechol pathway
MIFDVPKTAEFASGRVTLDSGITILTGTPTQSSKMGRREPSR